MLLLDKNNLRIDGKIKITHIFDSKIILASYNHTFTILGSSLEIQEYSSTFVLIHGKVDCIEVHYV